MEMHHEEEVRALAIRALRARLSGDVPTLEQISSRWLIIRLRALEDDLLRVCPGERWDWATDADRDAIWTAVRVWNGSLPDGEVMFQDYPDGTQHAYVPFAFDEDSTYSVVCEADDGAWRYHDTTRTKRDANGPSPQSGIARRPSSAPVDFDITSSALFSAAIVMTAGSSNASDDDDYWNQYDSAIGVSRSASPTTSPTTTTTSLKQPRPSRPAVLSTSSSSAPASSTASLSPTMGRRSSTPASRLTSTYSLQREKQMRESIRQTVKGLYALASLNGLSAGEFISLVKDSCEL